MRPFLWNLLMISIFNNIETSNNKIVFASILFTPCTIISVFYK